MNNSSVIVAALFAAFVIVITQRGELPIYLGFILATPKPSGGTPVVPAGTNPSSGVDTKTLFETGVKALPYLL